MSVISYPNIDPVIVHLGPLSIHWYGVMYLIGFSVAWFLGVYRCENYKAFWNKDQIGDVIFYAAIGVVIGGRLGYVLFYNFSYFLSDPLWLFRVWEGGMSFHGGLLGVLIAMFLVAKQQNKTFFQLTDFIAPLVPVGLGMGRVGNFIGGELWGRVTDVSWAMIFPSDPSQLPRHPSQLYQFAVEGVLLFIILWCFSLKNKPRMAVSGMFLLMYGLGRFSMEFFRQPDEQLGFIAFHWLTMGQLLSTPMILLGTIFLVIAYKKYPLIDGMNIDERLVLKTSKPTKKEKQGKNKCNNI